MKNETAAILPPTAVVVQMIGIGAIDAGSRTSMHGERWTRFASGQNTWVVFHPAPERHIMRIGGSLFLLAIGAILTFAVTANSALVGGVSVDWDTVGVILMIIGAVGLLWSLMTLNAWRERTAVVDETRVVDAPVVERDRYVGP